MTSRAFELSTTIEERLKKAHSVWFDLDTPLFDVHLFVGKEIVKFFKRKPLNGQSIVGEDKDGSIELVVSISHEMEIIPLILWYMPHIKVLEPQWIDDCIAKRIAGYMH